MIQIFDVVTMSSEMGCIVINVAVRTRRQKKHIVVAKSKRTLLIIFWLFLGASVKKSYEIYPEMVWIHLYLP